MARASGLTQTGCCSATDHPAAAPTDNALMHDHSHRPGDARSPAKPPPAPDGTIYTCPMHQQIRQVGPGVCPICGMALEPELASAEAAPNPELADMTRRFWIALVLTLPVLALEMGGHLTNLHMLLGQKWSNWLQFVFATPVVLWAGWPFFVRGWHSLVTRTKNGQPAHSTTGVANTNCSQFDHFWPSSIWRSVRWPPISSARTGSVSTSATQNRRVMSASSGFGAASAETNSGSSAMPQIGQKPGPTCRICGCIGHV